MLLSQVNPRAVKIRILFLILIFRKRSTRAGKHDWHELCMQLIQFASHSEKINYKQLFHNQQLQQDNQQRIDALDDVRQELASLKSDLVTITTERDYLKMKNEELIQNNQSLEIERNDLKEEVAHQESRMLERNQQSEVSTTDSLSDDQKNYGLDFSTLRKADHVRTADLEAQLNSKKEEIVKLRHMLGTTEQEDFQLQSANNKLQLNLQATKDSILTQLNAYSHDFQSYKDHISIKLGSADAEIRRLKKKFQVSHELYTDICRGKESLARKEDASIFIERNQSTHYKTDNAHTPVLWAHESFAPKCYKSEPFLPHVNVPSNLRFGQVDHITSDRKPGIPISHFVHSPSPSRSHSRKRSPLFVCSLVVTQTCQTRSETLFLWETSCWNIVTKPITYAKVIRLNSLLNTCVT